MPAINDHRRERYAQLLAQGQKTQLECYVAAGFACNDGHAARTAARADVRARVAEIQERAAVRAEISAAWLLKRLAEESTADIADLYAADGSLKPVKDWPLIWRQGLVAGLDVETIGEGAGRITKIKLSDRVKRLELIGKHIDVQAFKEKIEHSGGITLNVSNEDARL